MCSVCGYERVRRRADTQRSSCESGHEKQVFFSFLASSEENNGNFTIVILYPLVKALYFPFLVTLKQWHMHTLKTFCCDRV
jgi:hypothetical protein